MSAFSQNVTEIKDTTKIVLTTDVARQVAIDLIEGDQAKEELRLQELEIQKLKNVITLQDSLDVMRGHQISSLEKVIEISQIQVQQNREDFDRLNKEVRRQSAWKTVFATTTGVTAATLIAVLLFGGK